MRLNTGCICKSTTQPTTKHPQCPKTICPQRIPPLIEKRGVVLIINDYLGVMFMLVWIVECLLIFLYAVNLLNGPRLNQLCSIPLKNIVNEITWFQVHKFMWHHWQGKVLSSQVIAVMLSLDTHHTIQ